MPGIDGHEQNGHSATEQIAHAIDRRVLRERFNSREHNSPLQHRHRIDIDRQGHTARSASIGRKLRGGIAGRGIEMAVRIGLEQNLPAIGALNTRERGLYGTQNFDIGRRLFAQSLRDYASRACDLVFIFALKKQQHHATEGRITQTLTRTEFALCKSFKIVVLRALHGFAIGHISLNNDFPRNLAPPGASADLSQQLECAFTGAKIGQMDTRIRRNNTHERHAGKIEALGDHLRTE